MKGGIFGLVKDLIFSLRYWSPSGIKEFTKNPLKTIKRFFSDQVSSIKTQARRSIMYYPVFVSDSCSFELAVNVKNAVESQCAVLSKLAIERVSTLYITRGENKDDLIKRVLPKQGLRVLTEEFSKPIEELYPDLKPLLEDWEFGEMNDSGLNMIPASKFVKPGYDILHEGGTRVDPYDLEDHKAALRSREQSEQRSFQQAENRKNRQLQSFLAQQKEKAELRAINDKNLSARELEEIRALHRQKDAKQALEYQTFLQDRKSKDQLDMQIHRMRTEINAKSNESWAASRVGASRVRIEQKINRAEPILLNCEIEWVSEYTIQPAMFTIGIKSPMHIIPSEDIIRFLPESRYNGKHIVKIAKLLSGEISFFREFLFNVDTILDYFDKDKSGERQWYRRLKRMGEFNSNNAAIGQSYCPTASMVISMNDVDEIYRVSNSKVNLLEYASIKMLLSNMCLLNFIIIDEAAERVMWWDENTNQFDILALADLENEVKNGISKSDTLKMVLAASKSK